MPKPLENKPGQGVMFFRDNVEGNRPNFQGGFNWEGEEFEIAGWSRESKGGRQYISLKIQKPRHAARSTSREPDWMQ